jgi:hypothetical protein
MTKIDKTEIRKLLIEFDGDIENEDVDLGGVHFQNNGREYSLDTAKVTRYDNVIEATLERDDEVFPDSRYDLTSDDLLHGVNIEAYIESDSPIKDIHVIVRYGDLTMAIQANKEQ